jgi:hypothetical protein
MENNSTFPDQPVSPAELRKVFPEFQASLVNGRGHDKEMVSIKNDIKDIVLNLLEDLAEYVTNRVCLYQKVEAKSVFLPLL